MEQRGILNLILIGLSNLMAGVSMSILAPFYPGEALTKGVSITQSGIVLGSVFLTTIIFTPILGKYMATLGARRFLLLGTLVCGLGNLASGWLDKVQGSTAFFALSLTMRVLAAIGESAIPPAALTLATIQVERKHEGKAIAVCETCLGVGTMFGSSVGGLLYGLGGFGLPFWVCGGVQLALLLPCTVFLKDLTTANRSLDEQEEEVTWLRVLRAPGVAITCVALLMAGTSWSWYSASLQPFLEKTYDYTPTTTGLVFMTFGLTYTLFTPVFGWLSDYGLGGIPALIMGNSIMCFGFLFLGPIPLLERWIGSNAWLTITSVAVQGIGCSATYIISQVLHLLLLLLLLRSGADTSPTTPSPTPRCSYFSALQTPGCPTQRLSRLSCFRCGWSWRRGEATSGQPSVAWPTTPWASKERMPWSVWCWRPASFSLSCIGLLRKGNGRKFGEQTSVMGQMGRPSLPLHQVFICKC